MTSAIGFQEAAVLGQAKKSAYRTATFCWGAALLIGSLQPGRPGNIHFGILHLVAHLLSFGVLGFLATSAFAPTDQISWTPAACVFLFGFAIEFFQHWHNAMSIEWPDVADDGIGILASVALFHFLCRRPARRLAEAMKLDRTRRPSVRSF
jgi:hypothetical protein